MDKLKLHYKQVKHYTIKPDNGNQTKHQIQLQPTQNYYITPHPSCKVVNRTNQTLNHGLLLAIRIIIISVHSLDHSLHIPDFFSVLSMNPTHLQRVPDFVVVQLFQHLLNNSH